MVQEKIHACLKANNIELPPMSQDYLIEDFEPFFEEIIKAKKLTKDAFKFQWECIDYLGKIPLKIPAWVDLKTLEFKEECIEKDGGKFAFKGKIKKEKGLDLPQGVGILYTEKKLEFGVFNEKPHTKYIFYPDS